MRKGTEEFQFQVQIKNKQTDLICTDTLSDVPVNFYTDL